jgi:MFS family permease
LAAALGPVIGGLLVTVNWRWIFLVNVPIGLVAMLVGWWKLPEIAGHEAPRPNPWDAAFVTGGIGALTFAIVKVNDWGWGSPGIAFGTSMWMFRPSVQPAPSRPWTKALTRTCASASLSASPASKHAILLGFLKR